MLNCVAKERMYCYPGMKLSYRKVTFPLVLRNELAPNGEPGLHVHVNLPESAHIWMHWNKVLYLCKTFEYCFISFAALLKNPTRDPMLNVPTHIHI